MATLGAVSPAVLTLGLAIESTSGVLATAPTLGITLGAESRPKNVKPSGQRRTYSNADPVLTWRKGETTDITLPMLPVLEDNGLGELMLAHFGTDTPTRVGASAAYIHAFTRADLIKTLTLWIHDGLHDKAVRMNGVESIDITAKKEDGDVAISCVLKGADMAESATFGSPTFLDTGVAQARALNGFQGRFEWGQPAANIRDTWTQLKFSSKRPMTLGPNSKAGNHFAGSGSPQLITSSECDTTLDIDFIDTDGEEERRIRAGQMVAATAVQQSDAAALVNYRFTLFGNQADAANSPWGEADIANTGAVTPTIAGTYSGGATVTMYELKVTTAASPNKYSWRSCTGGIWTAWSAEIDMLVTATAVGAEGLTVIFSSLTANALGDKFYVYSHPMRFLRVVSMTNRYESLTDQGGKGFDAKTASCYHTSGSTGTKPLLSICIPKAGAFV
jgi:hypothetical protein